MTQKKPEEDGSLCIKSNTETENLRSMFHLVTWKKSLGGAGVMPEIGKWKNVKSVYPLHNKAATKALLVKWSRQLILREEDLDQIRGLFGEKVPSMKLALLMKRTKVTIFVGCDLLCFPPGLSGCSCIPINHRYLSMALPSSILTSIRHPHQSLVHHFPRILETERSRPKSTMVGQGSRGLESQSRTVHS